MDYILIDVSTSASFVLKAPLREVELHAALLKLQRPEARFIAPPCEGRGFTKLTPNQLLHFLYSLGQTPEGEYHEQIQQAREAVLARATDPTPLRELERQVTKLKAEAEHLAEEPADKPVVGPRPPKPVREPRVPGSAPTKGATGMVWEVADKLLASLGRMPTSKEVVAGCAEVGVKSGTASVQYGKWKRTK